MVSVILTDAQSKKSIQDLLPPVMANFVFSLKTKKQLLPTLSLHWWHKKRFWGSSHQIAFTFFPYCLSLTFDSL